MVFAFLYFIWLLAYVAWAFRLGAKAAGGVTHWRMLHAGWGALLLAVVFVSGSGHRPYPLRASGCRAAHPAGRARRGAELLLRVRAAAMASAHLAVGRAVWLSRGARLCRGSIATQRGCSIDCACSSVSAVGATGAAVALWDDEDRP